MTGLQSLVSFHLFQKIIHYLDFILESCMNTWASKRFSRHSGTLVVIPKMFEILSQIVDRISCSFISRVISFSSNETIQHSGTLFIITKILEILSQIVLIECHVLLHLFQSFFNSRAMKLFGNLEDADYQHKDIWNSTSEIVVRISRSLISSVSSFPCFSEHYNIL